MERQGADQFKIYRGETRFALPTPEFPDPAKASREQPHEFMQHWMHKSYPWSKEGYSGVPLTVGQHWTRSPEIIPERFAVEPLGHTAQPGVPMGRREATTITRREAADYTDFGQWKSEHGTDDYFGDRDRYDKIMRGHENYAARAEKEGVNAYRDLSGGEPGKPGRASRFRMGVVWEGQHPAGGSEKGTNYEDEHNLAHGSTVPVTGARIYVPNTQEVHDFTQKHPSPFTHSERQEAAGDVMLRSTYSHIGATTSVPWSRIQFPEAVHIPVDAYTRSAPWAR